MTLAIFTIFIFMQIFTAFSDDDITLQPSIDLQPPVNYRAICALRKVAGTQCPGSLPSIRYYFSDDKSTCLSFKYNGCGGNANNFETAVDCIKCHSYAAADSFQCWAPQDGTQAGTECGGKFSCKPEYKCIRGPFFHTCCYTGDDKCPDKSEIHGSFADNCDDLICPAGHECNQGKVVARCCKKPK